MYSKIASRIRYARNVNLAYILNFRGRAGLSFVDYTSSCSKQQTIIQYFEEKRCQSQRSPAGGDIGNRLVEKKAVDT